MVIRVGNERVYRFSANSTIIAEIYDKHAEVLVLPDRRRFRVSDETAMWRDDENYVSLIHYIENGLRDGVLVVDEEVFS